MMFVFPSQSYYNFILSSELSLPEPSIVHDSEKGLAVTVDQLTNTEILPDLIWSTYWAELDSYNSKFIICPFV